MHIIAENIQKSFYLDNKINIRALKNITLEIPSGETLAIVGPSGAGKSTLLHILGLMDRPTSGKLLIDGMDFSNRSDREHSLMRQEKIGFLFQLHYLLPDFTVWENIMIPVWEIRKKKEALAYELIERLALRERMNHMPSELSGGEQQRVALARALINNPRVLMADEPTGNLDRETGEKVEELIFAECRKRSVTLLLVTHNNELSLKADRIIRMCDGLIVQ